MCVSLQTDLDQFISLQTTLDLSGKIFKIKAKCDFSKKALDLTGKKKTQHLNQCKEYQTNIRNQQPMVEETKSMQVVAVPMVININLVVERAVLTDNAVPSIKKTDHNS